MKQGFHNAPIIYTWVYAHEGTIVPPVTPMMPLMTSSESMNASYAMMYAQPFPLDDTASLGSGASPTYGPPLGDCLRLTRFQTRP